MSGMPDAQQKKVIEIVKTTPDITVGDSIEEAKTRKQTITQLNIQMGPKQIAALNKFATTARTSPNEAALNLIEEGLQVKGYLESSEES
jgi:hypothetical protein